MHRHGLVRLGVALSLCALTACFQSDDPSVAQDTAPDASAFMSPPPPGALPSPSGPSCDPVDGSGCGQNETCRLTTAPICRDAPEPGVVLDQPCASEECAPGLKCLLVAATGTAARCRKLCHLETGAGCEAVPEHECRIRLESDRWGACAPLPDRCNPYAMNPCPIGQSCQPFLLRTGSRELRCRPFGIVREGGLCGSGVGTCIRGLACVASPDGTSAICRRYCELDRDCREPERCVGEVLEPSFTFCLP